MANTSVITLGVDKTVDPPKITAVAVDEDGNKYPDGSLITGPNKKIKWVHDTEDKEQKFLVRFFPDATKNQNSAGWPFKMPSAPVGFTLEVPPPTGDTTKLRNRTNVDWHYEVKFGALILDPMIIIRGRSLTSTVALAFAGGVVAGIVATMVVQLLLN